MAALVILANMPMTSLEATYCNTLNKRQNKMILLAKKGEVNATKLIFSPSWGRKLFMVAVKYLQSGRQRVAKIRCVRSFSSRWGGLLT